MMEALYFTLIGVALYFAADWILNRIEQARGARFQHRDLIYFAIILTLALATFYLINHFGSRPG
jgi:TRAP-type C4-dicarboxylate transport system permease small subunit